MANSLYELTDQLKAIDDILDNSTDAETSEILESAKEEILAAIDNKCEHILAYQSDLKAKIEQLKQEELRIHAKKKVLENRVEYLRQMLIWYMKTNNKTKMSCGTYDLTLGESAGKVVLDVPEEQIPAYLKRVTYTVDKTALKNTMINDCLYVADGDDLVLLAHLEPTPILRIK